MTVINLRNSRTAQGLTVFLFVMALLQLASIGWRQLTGPVDEAILGVRLRIDDLGRPWLIVMASVGLGVWLSPRLSRRFFIGNLTACLRSLYAHQAAAVGLAAILIGAVYVGGYLSVHQQPVGYLILVGDRFAPQGLEDPNVPVLQNSYGYDGQFFYRIAQAPFDTNPERSPTVDIYRYRWQRILYPWAAYAVSFGGYLLTIPSALLAVNLFALGIMGWAGGRFAAKVSLSPWWGLVLALYPGFVISLMRDLAEPLTVALTVTGLVSIRSSRFIMAALALTLAVLTRETAIIAVGGVGLSVIVDGVQRCRGKKVLDSIPWYVAGLPMAGFLIWQWWIFDRFGLLSFQNIQGNFAPFPFLGVWGQFAGWNDGVHPHWSSLDPLLLSFLYLSGLFALLHTIFSKGPRLHENASFVVLFAMVSLFGWSILQAREGFLRAMSDYQLFVWVILLASQSPVRWIWGGVWIGLTIWTSVLYL